MRKNKTTARTEKKSAPANFQQPNEDRHIARSSYNYDDNYSDYANNEGYRAYQDFSESGLRTDEPRMRRDNYGTDDRFERTRDESFQRARGFDQKYEQNDMKYGSDAYREEDANYSRRESQRPSRSDAGSENIVRSKQSIGQHSGKGPKGYRRSDDRIQEDVSETLSHNAEIDASGIEVSVKDGIVTLQGTIESRHIKRLAEEVINELPGVLDINNNLRIDTTLASKGATYQGPSSTQPGVRSSRQ